MALGVLNNLSAIYAENNLNNTNVSLQNVLRQLSSGSRINSGADDAAGLSLVNGLLAGLAKKNAYLAGTCLDRVIDVLTERRRGVVVADIVVDRGAAIDTEVSRSAGHLLGPAHAVGK